MCYKLRSPSNRIKKTFKKSKSMAVNVLLNRSMFRKGTFGKRIIATSFFKFVVSLALFIMQRQFIFLAGVTAGVSPNQHQTLLAFSKFLSEFLKDGMSLTSKI